MNGLYSLRRTDFSVRLGTVLFLLLLGYSYVFAFLMVRHWAGLTPSTVSSVYVPRPALEESHMEMQSQSSTKPLDFSSLAHAQHQVDTDLLIQDSHIHIMIYAIVAALETLIILGLEWRPAGRNIVITAAFVSGGFDFAGQWLMKAGIGGFAWLTIMSGWTMAAVYLMVLAGTVVALWPRQRTQEQTP